MIKTREHNTLLWIKGELDETISQARLSLEDYIEGSGDDESIRACAEKLHQIYGTLRMVQLYGVSMLTEEMENTATALLEHEVKHREEAAETLMRALIQLPDYLEKLQAGYPDIPLIVLPLMNDLRAARDMDLLSEVALFAPGMEQKLADQVGQGKANAELPELARRLRHRYHKALLSWYRGEEDPDAGLGQLKKIMSKLGRASGTGPIRSLFQISEAVIIGLKEESISPGIAVKILIGKLDRQIKQIIEEGEEAAAKVRVSDLQKSLLYYVAQADSEAKQIQAVRSEFGIEDILPSHDEIEAGRSNLGAPNKELLEAVSEAICGDLRVIKDGLDLYMRSDAGDIQALAALEAPMRKVADTLGMVGQGAFRERMKSRADSIRGFVERGSPPSESELDDVARDIIFVETAVDNLVSAHGGEAFGAELPSGVDVEFIGFASAEHEQLVGAVIHEATVDMARAKDAFVEFLSAPANKSLLAEVPPLLGSIAGALSMLQLGDAAGLLGSVASYIEEAMLPSEAPTPPDQLNALADAITSVEFFMDAVATGRADNDEVLNVARDALVRLGATDAAGAPSRAEELEPDLLEVGEELTLGETELPSEVSEPQASSAKPALDELDSEIVGIFVEEAREEVAVIQEYLPIWRKNSDDSDALTTIRRSFHTLKGSGRLVGAQSIGELAWSLEDLLNRVIDEMIPVTPDVLSLLDRVIGVLPELVDLHEAGEGAEELSQPLMDEAFALVDSGGRLPGGAPEPAEAAKVEEVAEPAEAIEPAEAPVVGEEPSQEPVELEVIEPEAAAEPAVEAEDESAIDMDSVLYEIFEAESRGHLGTVRDFLALCQEEGGAVRPEKSLSRAFHTLHGSARMAEVEPIARISYGLECLANQLLRQKLGADAEIQELLANGLETMEQVLAAINTPGSKLPPWEPLAEKIEQCHSALKEEGEVAELEAISTDDAFLAQDAFPESELEVDIELDDELDAALELDEGLELELDEGLALELEPSSEQTPAVEIALDEIADASETEETLEVGGAIEEEPALELDESLELEVEELEPASPTESVAVVTEEEAGVGLGVDSAFGVEIEVDEELVEIFLEEARELLDTLENSLQEWLQEPAGTEPLADLQRTLHTFKGGARLAGIMPAGDLSHAFESMLTAVDRGQVAATPELLALAQSTADRLMSQVEQVETTMRAKPADDLIAVLEGCLKGEEVAAAPEVAEQEAPEVSASEPIPAPEITVEEAAVEVEESQLAEGPELDEELVEIFLEEARELLDTLENSLQEWLQEPSNTEPLAALQRTLHTFKGGARLAGIMPAGDLSHAFESLLTAVDKGQLAPTEELLALAKSAADRLMGQVEQVETSMRAKPATDLIAALEGYLSPGEVKEAEPAPAPPTEEKVKEAAPPTEQVAPHTAVEEPQAERPAAAKPRQEQVRVRSDLLDRLVNNAGEVSIYRARLEQQNSLLSFNLSELDQTVIRLNDQLRKLDIETEAQILFRYEREREEAEKEEEGFDPLEMDRFSTLQQLSRALMETVNDLVSIKDLLEDLNRENDTLLLQQSRVATDLQDGLLRTRMVPFSQLVPRLHRVVRQTCVPLGKQASLIVHGAEGELDRGILDRMVAPLEHILRNALSHGIELPAVRAKAGKPEEGSIHLTLSREGTELVITVVDDGGGIDSEAIRKRAIKKGMLAEDATISDQDLVRFILEPGFSTATEVTQISGRGVGMDVVFSEIKQLGGALEIDSKLNKGSTFTIRLPLTLAITDALLIELGDDIFAIPHTSIEGVVRVSRADLLDYYDGHQEGFAYAGHSYMVRYLGAMLGEGNPHLSEQVKWLPMLLVRSGGHRIALQVDGLLGNRQIVVKSVGRQLSSVRWITGGTILGDGRVALILDVSALVRTVVVQPLTPLPMGEEETIAAEIGITQQVVEEVEPDVTTVMVVDDSITVRKVTTRLLERHNMHVLTAKDGVDAVAKLQEQLPDIMLLDIEMPRMDGYELARHMRSTERLKDIPIIMITSRTGDKHRKLAMEVGVKRYLGKPFQEADLMENIRLLLAEKSV